MVVQSILLHPASCCLQALFEMPTADAIQILQTTRHVLEQWFDSYMQVRESIESSARDARWEFSKPLLFERTTYMAEVCAELAHIIAVLDDFHVFLGPELKAVTGDIQESVKDQVA